MSKLSDLPRNPAYAGMMPETPSFVPAGSVLSKTVSSSVPGTTRVTLLSVTGSAAPRFFRAERGAGNPSLFLKLMDKASATHLSKAEGLIAALPPDGPAVQNCGVFPIADGTGRVLVAYPCVEGRFLAAPGPDMRVLGREIARLHSLLATLPARDAIRARAHERACELDAALSETTRHRALLARAGIEPLSGGIVAALQDAGAQPLHGDLNIGNILIENASGAVRFLDFEDVRHSHGPPILDLALPVERFCLLLEDRAAAASAAIDLLQAYADEAGASPILRRGDLANSLGVVNRRAVALLLLRHEAGVDAPDGEWRKFGDLLRWIEERAGVIETIEKVLIS